MDYKGYKLIDKIILVCRDSAEKEDSHGWNPYRTSYQAYLVDPANKKQLESARYWAKWTEYGPSRRTDDGKWVRDYEIEHAPVEFEFDNNGFELELLDCAGGSSQGGKLSFWNCVVTKNDTRFVIGINSDMLLDLLKNATFINGKCQSPLIFITQKGKVGMTVEGSETHQQCMRDKELLHSFKTAQTNKFAFGDLVSTATINEVYLGTITKYYEFDPGENRNRYRSNYSMNLRDCTLTKLKNPIKYHLFESMYKERTLVEILGEYDKNIYSYPDVKMGCPKRAIVGKIEMDCTEDEFKRGIMEKTYNYDAYVKRMEEYSSFYKDQCSDNEMLYYYLGKNTFGYGFEPFELSQELMDKIKASGVKYIEE